MTVALTPRNNQPTDPKAGASPGSEPLSPSWVERLSPDGPLKDETALRDLLVARGYCPTDAPAVSLELYGGLRLRTGCEVLPLRAGTVGAALTTLRQLFPKVERLLPANEKLGEYYRFSINGRMVTTDLNHPLVENDHLILFSASVGG